jgi:hypothetical protein
VFVGFLLLSYFVLFKKEPKTLALRGYISDHVLQLSS